MLNRISMNDNGGRRKKADRRQYTYTIYIPDRRSGMDRRSGEDRRKTARANRSEILLTY